MIHRHIIETKKEIKGLNPTQLRNIEWHFEEIMDHLWKELRAGRKCLRYDRLEEDGFRIVCKKK